MLTNAYAIPVPNPPPNSSNTTNRFLKTSDSTTKKTEIDKRDFIIYLDTVSEIGELDIVIDSIERYSLKNSIFHSNRIIDTSKIDIKKHIKFCNEKVEYPFNFKKIDMVISFSEILFNSKYDKAILKIGVSRGRLAGHSTLLVCKKIEGNWKIIKSHLVEIS